VNVAVCDYGAGNVRSVVAAFTRLGATARVTREPQDILAADLAVLPGVGSAASAMRGLCANGLDAALRARVDAGGQTLGICLGLQLALDESEEDGGVAGLALLPGRAVRLRAGRVPRMGWARVEPSIPAAAAEAFYFAHSYAAETPAAISHSEGVVAVAESGSFLGVQFHPEKSGPAGARFLVRCLSRA
jgi:imidazole glycerol phosphate synthase glutamine amidotransferase subunit